MSYKKIVHHDIEEDGKEYYTIYHAEKGGPIITADALEKAEADYKTALQLCEAVKKFLHFKNTGRWLER